MTIYLSVAGLIYTLLLSILFFSKKKVNTVEIKIYGTLIIVTLLALVSELLIPLVVYLIESESLLTISLKFNLISVCIWFMTLLLYVINLSHDKLIVKKWFLIIYTLSIVAIIATVSILPVEFYHEGGKAYSYGSAVDFLYAVSTVLVLFVSGMILLDIKNIKKKQYMPIILLIILITISSIIQNLNPEILINNFLYAFTVFFMYHTIENPDVKMIEQLEIAKGQAEKANQAKSDFLSNMSHEIRTPLNAIVGFSQALQEDENLPESAKDEVNDIISASNSLLEIVNGILDISKIEADKLEIINTEYNFKKVFNELVSLTKARLGDKPLDLRFSYDDSIPGVLYGDHSRIKQIILNLLTNAVKYTKEGYVELKVSSVIQGDVCRLIVSVEDSGIGIKNENIDKLFSKFERFDLEKNMTIEGTGLGLAITKKLVELMNGKIVVQSVYGKGSKFTVAIDQKIVIGKEAIVEDSENEVEIFDASNKKILVVDDNKINLKVASRLLSNYSVQIETVESGFDCIAKLENGSTYDLILMDDMMPRMSGVETFHKLKEKEGFNIPVVALTANAISGMREKYLSEGFNDYLSKPIDKLELSIIMKKYLRK